MSRVRVFADVQNPKPGMFIVTVDMHLTLIGNRDQVIEELQVLRNRDYLNGVQCNQLIDKIRGK